jgi:hypothetical protein
MPDEDVVGMVTETVEEPTLFSDQPEETPEIPGEIPETTDQPEEVDQPEEPEDAPENVQKLPSVISKLLREIKEANPDSAPITKELSKAYFMNRSYQQVFPSLEDAKVLKASFDAIGGQEGLLKLQGVSDTLEDLDRMLDSGDPKLVEDILAQSPEGFSRIVPHALKTLERSNPQAYENIMRPMIANAILGTQVGLYVQGAMDSLKAGDADMASRRLGVALNWFLHQQQEAEKSAAESPDPRATQFEEQSKGIAKRELEMNQRWVERDMNQYSASGIETALRPMLKGLNLSTDARSDLSRGIIQEIGNALLSDKTFQRQMDALVQRGEVDKAFQLAKVHIDRIRPEAVKSVFGRRYGNVRPTAPKNGVKPATSRTAPGQTRGVSAPGGVQVPRMPPIDAIDRNRTTSMMVMEHKAILKDGRTVTWPR